ncbi:MAG: hypothetical protein K2O40_03120 [Lachnospiraceae bacterium]|nr:hypothetical protein [Lachnospiraceae bacterium]
MDSQIYDVIMPLALKDMDTVMKNSGSWFRFLPIKHLIIIGNAEVQKHLANMDSMDGKIRFIDEGELLEIGTVRDIMCKAAPETIREDAVRRAGWYLQQFLKMLYAYICEDEYYMTWDSDTVPLVPIEMMHQGRPVFHMKEEYYPAYFNTMGRILPGMGKRVRQSFISEHMLIRSDIMKEMIEEIERQNISEGRKFYETILYAVDKDMLPHSGFSEFETYGTYTDSRYPDLYEKIPYRSLRDGSRYFVLDQFGSREAEWLKGIYQAVSFEKGDVLLPEHRFFNVGLLQSLFGFDEMAAFFMNLREQKKRMKKALKDRKNRV